MKGVGGFDVSRCVHILPACHGESGRKVGGVLAGGPTRSFGSVKKLFNDAYSETLETQMEREAQGIVDMSKKHDAMEEIKDFMERRCPGFTGM